VYAGALIWFERGCVVGPDLKAELVTGPKSSTAGDASDRVEGTHPRKSYVITRYIKICFCF